MNEIVVEALKAGIGLSGSPVRHTDLDDLAGTWVNDPEFDRAIQEMDKADPELCKLFGTRRAGLATVSGRPPRHPLVSMERGCAQERFTKRRWRTQPA